MNKAEKFAKILWDYHVLHQTIKKSDCIIALGNSDIRTAQKAAELFNEGLGNFLVVTGGFGRLTKDKFKKPEAHIFTEEAVRLGVPSDKIIIEDASTNTFDNVRFTKKMLEARNIHPDSFIVVTKPYMERRAFATFSSVWPDVLAQVTSPNLGFHDYPNDVISMELLINMIVGDQQRLMIFSESGYIFKQQFPTEVIDAYNNLVELGFDKQIIPESNIGDLLAAVTKGSQPEN